METNDSVRSKYLWLKERCLQLAQKQNTLLKLSEEGKNIASKWNIEVE